MPSLELEPWRPALAAYARWLEKQSLQVFQDWAKKLEFGAPGQVEGAAGEAVAWDFLCSRVDSIGLHEIPGTGGADFLCVKGGSEFLIEATTLSTDTTTRKTGLISGDLGPSTFSDLTRAVKTKLDNKRDQIAQGGGARPLAVFVVTFHFEASALCVKKDFIENLLHGGTHISMPFDTKKGEAVGEARESVNFVNSLFVAPSLLIDSELQAIRRPLSAVIVGGFGIKPPERRVAGVLHPYPHFAFDPAWLTDVPFGRFREWPLSECVEIVWSDEIVPPTPPQPKPRARIILPSEADYGDFTF